MKIGNLDTSERQRPYIMPVPEMGERQEPQPPRRSPLENVAAWLRSLRYEDMMQMSTEMHALKVDSPVETPEQLAKLLHSWAKATTEPTPQESR